jgi:hypothetical protein
MLKYNEILRDSSLAGYFGCLPIDTDIQAAECYERILSDAVDPLELIGSTSENRTAMNIQWTLDLVVNLEERERQTLRYWKESLPVTLPWYAQVLRNNGNISFTIDDLPDEDLLFWTNSHGDIYPAGEFWQSPKYGCWMRKSEVQKFLQSSVAYGAPTIIIPETKAFTTSALSGMPALATVSSRPISHSQNGLGACTGYSAAFAHRAGVLNGILRGTAYTDTPINPVYSWCDSKGGSMLGGQSIPEMGEYIYKYGNHPESLVGTDSISRPNISAALRTNEAVKSTQSNICLITEKNITDLTDAVFLAVAAGYGVFLGNSLAVNGTTTITSGRHSYAIARLAGGWQHATHFSAYLPSRNLF